MKSNVSIILVNWNGLKDTIECIKSLQEIDYPDFKVIVVDNASRGDDVQRLRERFPDNISIIQNDTNLGYAAGANVGMKYALHNTDPAYILLLNNDTVVAPEFLAEMVNLAETSPAIGIVGPKTYLYRNPDQLQLAWIKVDLYCGLASHVGSMATDTGQYDTMKEVDCIPGSCFLIKRSVLDKIGLLDEGYFSYWEETDFCVRAKRAGWQIFYCPKARIWHKVGQSARKVSGFETYYLVRNRFIFERKFATRWQYLTSMLYFFGFRLWFSSAVYLFYLRSFSNLISFYRGVRDGLKEA